MVIGVLQFELLVPGSHSLKDKRRVVKSLKDRLHREHLISIAEVEALDHHRLAVMGLSVVSNSAAYAGGVLDRVVEKLKAVRDARLGQVRREILTGEAWSGSADDLWSEEERRADEPAPGAGGEPA